MHTFINLPSHTTCLRHGTEIERHLLEQLYRVENHIGRQEAVSRLPTQTTDCDIVVSNVPAGMA